MRLAFFTPLNPVRSGISDYSEELLPHLGELADIDIVIDSYQPTNAEIAKRFRVLPVAEFLEHHRDSYDCIVYQIGNNLAAHGYMLPCLAVAPGIVVLHDYSLTHLMLPVTVQRGDYLSLEEILRPGYARRARSASLRVLLGLVDPYEVSLARPVIEMSRAVIVHNHHSFRKLAAEFPQKRIERIPHATPIRDLRKDIATLRSAYGFGKDDFLLASVSSLAYNKRIEVVLSALRDLTKDYPHMKFVMVGQGDLGGRGRTLIRRFGLEKNIVRTGWVSNQQYLDYIDLADVVIDLRCPTAGETSGSSLRAMQAAKPLVVSAEGFFLELPDPCCIRLSVDGSKTGALRTAVAGLIENPGERRRMGEAGRSFALSHLRIEQAARSYADFAREVAASSYPPTKTWHFQTEADPSLLGHLVMYAYGLGRLAYYCRHYGLVATLERVRSQTKIKNF